MNRAFTVEDKEETPAVIDGEAKPLFLHHGYATD
jgi:hypothetical protein